MKKILALLLMIALVLTSFVACAADNKADDEDEDMKTEEKKDNDEEAEDEQSASDEEEPETEKKPNAAPKGLGLNEEVKSEGVVYKIIGLETSKGSTYFKPKKGNVFLGVKIEMENRSENDITISTLLSFTDSVDGGESGYSYSAMSVFPAALDGSLSAGETRVGYYPLEVSEDWSYVKIDFTPSMFSTDTYTFVVTPEDL